MGVRGKAIHRESAQIIVWDSQDQAESLQRSNAQPGFEASLGRRHGKSAAILEKYEQVGVQHQL
jgi:hypothetical protein